MRTEEQKLRRKFIDSQNREILKIQYSEWKKNNPEKIKANKHRYYLKHRDSILESQKQYVESLSPELKLKRLERIKQHAKNNPEINLLASAKYRKNNPEKRRISVSNWVKNNPQKAREIRNRSVEAFKKRNPDKARTWNRINCVRYRARKAKVTYDKSADQFYKWVRSQEWVKCSYCPTFVHGKEAHIDHIVAISKGGPHIASNLCASCKTCNLKKNSFSVEEFRMRNNLISKEDK